MTDYFKAIDIIIKLIPFLKTFTSVRRREYFSTLVEPLFEAVQETHEFYNELFMDTRKKLVKLNAESIPFTGTELEHSLEFEKNLNEVKELFLTQRMQDEGLRDTLRNEAQTMFSRISWVQERRFLASVAYYFLGEKGIAPDDRDIDSDVNYVLEKGGISQWNTPSTRVYLELKKCNELHELIQMLDDARNGLNQKHMNVIKQFRQIQHEVIMHT